MSQIPHLLTTRQLADAWRNVVSKVFPVATAQSLYQGRSVTDTAAAASHLGVSWRIVSAGLGLVKSDDFVPGYECTVAPGSDLARRLQSINATAADWWNELTALRPFPLSHLIAQSPTLLALPSSYFRLVHDDLARVSPASANHLRIFTSSAGAREVPKHLIDCVMPYDERLESIREFAGTQSDFAQRALRHFVTTLEASTLPLTKARSAVAAALANQLRIPRSANKRMSDEEIREVLIKKWAQHDGKSTRLLRYLRDEACISCEQKRFSRLWQALAIELRN